MTLDTWTQAHLEAWLKSRFTEEEEQNSAAESIVRFLSEYPELLDARSWPEIYTLATRV